MNAYKFYFGVGCVLLGFVGQFFVETHSAGMFLIGFGGVTACFGLNEKG